ncbi:YkvA family protein [Rhodococcus daqingensis]|uniref:YkvA family protein n=1 Tax=Rhodococcus daqingensis TaxID=2479363 RepID=A0ABW2RT20_9NOCA
MWWSIALSVACGLLLLWLALLIALWITKPDEVGVKDALRLLPDVVRLIKRLGADPAVPRGVRVRLGLLLAYLAMPFDLIPDFIPVLGYADDAVIVAIALRSVTHRAGSEAIERHWPGTPEGLAAIRRLSGTARAQAEPVHLDFGD